MLTWQGEIKLIKVAFLGLIDLIFVQCATK